MLADVPMKGFFRPDEVAAHFNVSVDLIHQFLATGKLMAIQVSPRVNRIPRASICDYIRTYVKPA
ncbi:MAG: helix-turn-helix domain-containing protein [Gammaproteobacteria bacterium]|nr:helix-turn-helix domain-containing protein [Gammaproteobacteria bacterium]